MARLYVEGFETGSYAEDLSKWTMINTWWSVPQTSPPVGMSGSYYARAQDGNGAEIQLTVSQDEIYMAWKWVAYGGVTYPPGSLCQFNDTGGTAILSIRTGGSYPTHTISVRRGDYAASEIAVSTLTLNTIDITHLMEVHYKPLNSGGIIQVKVDGVLFIDFTGDTTNGLENIKTVHCGHGAGAITHGRMSWDDVVIDDAGWIGNTRIQKLQPTGAGSTTQWDPSTGSNWDCIEEIPASDTNYVSTNVSNEFDTYACGDLTGNISEIKSVAVYGRSAYEGSPTPTKQVVAIRVNANHYSGEHFSPSLGFLGHGKLWEQNPNTASAWTSGEVNSIEIGIKSVA